MATNSKGIIGRVTTTLAMTLLLSVSSATATVIQTLGGAPQVLIPAAGSTAGANGTFFHSDIYVSNHANRTQTVRFDWLPQAGNGGTTKQVDLPAGTTIRSADFVRDVLNVSGLGAMSPASRVPARSTERRGCA